MSKSITAIIQIPRPFTVHPGPMARAELRTRVVVGQKDLGMIHASHPAPPQQALANNNLREHPAYRADKGPAGDAATGQNAALLYAAWRHRPRWCRQDPTVYPLGIRFGGEEWTTP